MRMGRWALVALLGAAVACSDTGGAKDGPGHLAAGDGDEVAGAPAKTVSDVVRAPERLGSFRLSEATTVAPEAASVPTLASDARSGATYMAWAREVPAPEAGAAESGHDTWVNPTPGSPMRS